MNMWAQGSASASWGNHGLRKRMETEIFMYVAFENKSTNSPVLLPSDLRLEQGLVTNV